MSFDEIDRLLKDGYPDKNGLPPTARKRPQWWGNERSPHSTHSHAKYGWLAASWHVVQGELDLEGKTVTFRKEADSTASRSAR
jgi:hypothetical protein